MAGSGNNRTLVAAIRADVSAALASARQLADGFVRVGSAVRATDEQIKEAGKLLGTLRIKSESWTKAQVEGIEKQIDALAKLRRAGAVTGNEYDRFTASARAKIVRLGEALGQDMRTNAQKAEAGLKSLGVVSEASQKQAQAGIKQTIKDLKALKAQGEITALDMKNAMKAANKELGKDTRSLADKIRDAMKSSGVRRTIDVNNDIAAQKKLIAAYQEWGRKGRMSAEEVGRAVEGARKKIDELNKSINKPFGTRREQAQAITSKYGVDTKAETEKKIALINKEIEALSRLKAANQIDPRSFNAAIASMNKKIQELNKTLGNDTRSAADKAADVMKKFGVAGEAAVRKTVSELRQQIIEMNKARKAGEITERDFVASYRKMRAEIHALNQSIGKESKSAAQRASEAWTAFGLKRKQQIQEEIAGVRKTAQEALKAANLSSGERYRIEKTLADRVRALYKELARSVATQFQQRMTAASAAAQGASQKLISGAMGLAPVSLAAGAVDKSAFDRAVEMDKAWRSATSKLPTETVQALGELYKEAMRLGSETVFTSAQVANGVEAMAGTGVSAKDMTSGGLAAATYLASGIGVEMPEASRLLAVVSKQFKYSGDQMMEVANLLVGLRNNSTLTGNDLTFLFSMGGGVSSMIGNKSLEETAALQVMTSYLAGSGSDSGTSMKTADLNMISPEKAVARKKWGLDFYERAPEVEAAVDAAAVQVAEAERLLKLAERQEINSRASPYRTDADRERASEYLAQRQAEKERVDLVTGEMVTKAVEDAAARGFSVQLKPMRERIAMLEEKKNTLPEDKWLELAADIGGQDAVRQIAAMVDPKYGGVKGYDEALVKVRSGDAQKASEDRLAGLWGSLERMKGAWDNMLVSIIDSGIDDILIAIMDTMQDLFNGITNLSSGWKNFIGILMVFLGVIAPAAALMGLTAKIFGGLAYALSLIGPGAAGAAGGFGLLSKILGGLAKVMLSPIKALRWLATRLLALGAQGIQFVFARLMTWIGGLGTATLGLPAIAAVLFLGLGAALIYYRKEVGDFINYAAKGLADLMGLTAETRSEFDRTWRGSVIGGFFSREQPKEKERPSPDFIGPMPAFAKGVIGLRGPGTGTSDSIPAMLSNGESVITAASTTFWGSDFMRAIQRRDRSAVMRPVPVAVGGGRSGGGEGLATVHLHFEGGNSYELAATPSVAAQMSGDQNLKRLLRKTNPSKGFR